MTRLLYILLFVFALGYCHAQRDRFSMQDGFIFPGPADRPEKFPVNQGGGGRFTTQPPVNPQSTTLSPSQVDSCMRSCPTTSEYNPVCGTDNVQYTNPGKLSCAKFCSSMTIEIKRYGQCNQDNARG